MDGGYSRGLQAIAAESLLEAGAPSTGILGGEANSGEESIPSPSRAAGGRDTARGGQVLSALVAVEVVWPALRADFDIRCYYERIKR
jgi:hypothetical protein